MQRRGWLPPVSPYGLIQESLVPSEWLILVSCILLNMTSRKQVETVFPEFMKRWPTPTMFLTSAEDEVRDLIKVLGFKDRRTSNLFKMTRQYVTGDWTHARELAGIGEYGSRAWEIFCCGIVGDAPPKDHALVQYFTWLKEQS
jgi:methyl-CpG-binding domain protein 4